MDVDKTNDFFEQLGSTHMQLQNDELPQIHLEPLDFDKRIFSQMDK